jgi:DNA-binding XRE family transcriptional regulator
MKKYPVKVHKTKSGVKYVVFREWLNASLCDPEFKKEYDALEPKYALISAMITARSKKGMTQSEIAKRAGTTQSAIARFESGRTNPSLEFASRLSRALGAKLEIRLGK